MWFQPGAESDEALAFCEATAWRPSPATASCTYAVKIDAVDIPDEELDFTTSRSSGPGGQNVNKVSTRVTLLFDVEHSARLSDRQRELLHERLPGASTGAASCA